MALGKLGSGQLGLGAQLSALKKWQIGPRIRYFLSIIANHIITIQNTITILRITKHPTLKVKHHQQYQIHCLQYQIDHKKYKINHPVSKMHYLKFNVNQLKHSNANLVEKSNRIIK